MSGWRKHIWISAEESEQKVMREILSYCQEASPPAGELIQGQAYPRLGGNGQWHNRDKPNTRQLKRFAPAYPPEPAELHEGPDHWREESGMIYDKNRQILIHLAVLLDSLYAGRFVMVVNN